MRYSNLPPGVTEAMIHENAHGPTPSGEVEPLCGDCGQPQFAHLQSHAVDSNGNDWEVYVCPVGEDEVIEGVDDFGRLPSGSLDKLYEFQVAPNERLCVFAGSFAEAKELMRGRGQFDLGTIQWTGTHGHSWLRERYEWTPNTEREK